MGRAITDIRALCKQGEFGKALLLVETLRRKYPQNRQLHELEQRLHRALDDQGVP